MSSYNAQVIDRMPSFHEQLENLTLNIDDYKMSTAASTGKRNSPNEGWKSNRPTPGNSGWKVSSKPSNGPAPEIWKITSSLSDSTNRQPLRMPSPSPSLSSHMSHSLEPDSGGWKVSNRSNTRAASTSPVQSSISQPAVYFPGTPIMGMPEAIPTPRISHDDRLSFEEMQARRQSAPIMTHNSWHDNAYSEDGQWNDYSSNQYPYGQHHHDPYAYAPQINGMPSPAGFVSPLMSHMVNPSATPKPLPEEPPMPPPRKSLPAGFVTTEPIYSTPTPMLPSPLPPQQLDHVLLDDYHRPSPHYRYSVATCNFPPYHPESAPPSTRPPSTGPPVSVTPTSVGSAPVSKKEKNKKDKDKGKGKPERKVRQITVPSINKEHRVWINVDPTETGLSLAEKIHIIATFRTRKILTVTTASGRQIPLDHRPIFGSWVDMENFVDGEPWKVEWGDLDKGVVDKLLSKMVSGGRKPVKRDEHLDRI